MLVSTRGYPCSTDFFSSRNMRHMYVYMPTIFFTRFLLSLLGDVLAQVWGPIVFRNEKFASMTDHFYRSTSPIVRNENTVAHTFTVPYINGEEQ